MPSISKTVISVVALVAMVQYCPAPFLAAIPAATAAGISAAAAGVSAAAAVAGTVVTAVKDKRDVVENKREFVSRIKRQDIGLGTAWQDCHNQLTGASLIFSGPEPGSEYILPRLKNTCANISSQAFLFRVCHQPA